MMILPLVVLGLWLAATGYRWAARLVAQRARERRLGELRADEQRRYYDAVTALVAEDAVREAEAIVGGGMSEQMTLKQIEAAQTRAWQLIWNAIGLFEDMDTSSVNQVDACLHRALRLMWLKGAWQTARRVGQKELEDDVAIVLLEVMAELRRSYPRPSVRL